MRVKIAFAFCNRQSIWSTPEFLCAANVVTMMSRRWKKCSSVLFNILSRYDSHLAGILHFAIFFLFVEHINYVQSAYMLIHCSSHIYSLYTHSKNNNNQITKAHWSREVDNLAAVGSHRWRLLLLLVGQLTRGKQISDNKKSTQCVWKC